MKSQGRVLSSMALAGIATSLLGTLVMKHAAPATFMSWVGAAILLAGFFAALGGLLRAPVLACSGPALLRTEEDASRSSIPSAQSSRPTSTAGPACAHAASLIPREFQTWLKERETSADIWPDLDRWMRDVLGQVIGARYVRCYHATSDRRLESLTNPLEEGLLLGPTLPELIVSTLESGRRYIRGTSGNGELLERLATQWAASMRGNLPAPDWLLPVRDGNETVGLVIAGKLDDSARQDPRLLDELADLIQLCWRHVRQETALTEARRIDHATGVLNRADLSAAAARALSASTADGEPVVVLALSVEGMRRMGDEGQWELRDWVMKQVGMEMKRRLRSDDLIGRFSDDRFVALLRRLDLPLGTLITRKLIDAVEACMAGRPELAGSVNVRCGLTDGPGGEFEQLLGRAFEALQRARHERQGLLALPRHSEAPGGAR